MGLHFVPRFYLSGFATTDAIWAYDKKAERAFPTRVKSIANETSMYSDEVESYLANDIEHPALPAITRIRARQPLSENQRAALAKYIIALWKRVPKARTRVLNSIPQVADEVEQELNAGIQRLVDQDPSLTERAAARRLEIAAAIEREKAAPDPKIWQQSLQSPTDHKVVDALLSMNWLFLSSSEQFLTSDNPVFFFEHEGIGKPTSELSVPLSSSVALWATRAPCRNMQYYPIARPALREVNRRTVYNAVRFAYARTNEPWILPFTLKKDKRLTRLSLAR
jgi:hypothetical protein